MNEYNNKNVNEMDYFSMSLTEQVRARSIAESGSAPAPADKSDNEAVNSVQNAAADNSFSAENNVSEKAAPIKKSKRGRKKKTVSEPDNEWDALTKRLEELLPAAEIHDAENKKIHDEIDAVNKRLHELELENLDEICRAKGISTQKVIEYVSSIGDITQQDSGDKKGDG